MQVRRRAPHQFLRNMLTVHAWCHGDSVSQPAFELRRLMKIMTYSTVACVEWIRALVHPNIGRFCPHPVCTAVGYKVLDDLFADGLHPRLWVILWETLRHPPQSYTHESVTSYAAAAVG